MLKISWIEYKTNDKVMELAEEQNTDENTETIDRKKW